ncbi:peptidoglycan DD-metalloendopeptidase family protein [Gemmatimonadota bacterium]
MPRDLKDLYPQRKKILLHNKAAPIKKRFGSVLAIVAGLTLIGIFVFGASFSQDQNSRAAVIESDSLEQALQADSMVYSVYSQVLPWLSVSGNELQTRFTMDKVRKGDTFETVLKRNGIDRGLMAPLMKAAKGVYNLNRVVIGHSFEFSREDSLLTGLKYTIDQDQSLLLTLVDTITWNAEIARTEYKIIERGLSGTINSSLYQTVMDLCGLPELALKLSEVYAWQIDFHSEIRKGDSFRVIYEEKIHPEGTKKVGRLLAGVFNNRQKEYYAIGFTNAGGRRDYFDLEGESLRRAFLRSPFKYMPRISSRYSNRRFHPILKIYRPHLGIDYAAPTGTPVLALGDGRISSRGRNGGFGKYVQIKHNGMYATGYGHLSGYARGIKTGTWVKQGQVIGFIGSTGLSTGPHLDFRFYKNGKPINPLTVDIPAGDPVDPSLLSYFNVHRDRVVRRLEVLDNGSSSNDSPMTLETGEPGISGHEPSGSE